MTDQKRNERAVRDLYDVIWNDRQLDRFGDVFVEDVVIHAGTTDFTGRQAITEDFAKPFLAAFPDLHHDVTHLVLDGETASTRFHGTGTLTGDYGGLKASGQKLSYHGMALLHLKDGRIAEIWTYSDIGEWFAAQRPEA
jgi:steroid delta-isomerase-like uncharacterized protein